MEGWEERLGVAVGAATTSPAEGQSQTRTGWSMFLSVRSPASAKTNSVLPRRYSCVVADTAMPPGSATS